MRKFLSIFLFAILLVPAPVQAGVPVTISNQGILGGHMIDLTNSSNNSTTVSVGGDMTLFAGELRKKFENDPTVQDNTLSGMSRFFEQDISGVFRGQGLVGR